MLVNRLARTDLLRATGLAVCVLSCGGPTPPTDGSIDGGDGLDDGAVVGEVGGGRLAVGAGHACILRDDGTPVCFGLDFSGETVVPDALFTALLAGDQVSYGLTETGDVHAWGRVVAPVLEEGPFERVAINGGAPLCGLRGGRVFCRGDGAVSDAFRDAPPVGFREIAVLGGEICGIAESGEVLCWGCPMPPLDGNFLQLATSFSAFLALREDGAVFRSHFLSSEWSLEREGMISIRTRSGST